MFFGGVAQLGERLVCNQNVAGSIPVSSTIIKEKAMSHGGKGDTPRPYSVDQNTFTSNWEATFGKKKSQEEMIDEEIEVEGTVKDSEQGG